MTPKKVTEPPPKPEPTYEAFGDTLSVEVAFLQAAAILDLAALEAIRSKDTERMQALALSWMELGKLMFHGPDGEDEDEDFEEKEPIVVGFGKREQVEKVDE